jgi:hypothetical protein
MENREIENLFSQMMSPEHSDLEAPDTLLVFEARQAVLNRRKRPSLWPARFASVVGTVLSTLRLQHLGVAVVLVTTGLIYFSELNNSPNQDQTSAYDRTSIITATNNTISVISSTMLTSIPTLRN